MANNEKRPAIYDENLNFFRNLILQARLVWLLLRDSRVPLWLKSLPVGAVAYVFLPFDAIPDVIPILGQLDDVAALLLGFRLFIEFCPANVVAEHMQTLTGKGNDWEVQKTPPTPRSAASVDSDELESTVIDGTFSEMPNPPKDE
jgi:uncharacterized membrane protein YkvA (DUF1232 family)